MMMCPLCRRCAFVHDVCIVCTCMSLLFYSTHSPQRIPAELMTHDGLSRMDFICGVRAGLTAHASPFTRYCLPLLVSVNVMSTLALQRMAA